MVSSADALVKQIDGGFHGREQGQSGGRESHPHLSPSPAGLLESPARQALAGRYGASRLRGRRLLRPGVSGLAMTRGSRERHINRSVGRSRTSFITSARLSLVTGSTSTSGRRLISPAQG